MNWSKIFGTKDEWLFYLAGFGIMLIIPLILGFIYGATAFMVALFIEGYFMTFFL